nr:HNH endonuclease signature motif containing protein [Microbacterium bovistercoris]
MHPEVYTDTPGTLGVRAAELAVLLEIGLRLQTGENQIRNLAYTAQTASFRLPLLWRRAHEGFAAYPLVEAACAAITRLLPPDDADEQVRQAALAAIGLVDEQAAEWVLHLSAAAFRARLRALINRLDPRDSAGRHAAALADRRVVIHDEDDGMAWLCVLMPRIDAIATQRSLTSQAKHLQKNPAETRGRDQLRADLATARLRGQDTVNPVKTKVFVTIPVGILTGTAVGEGGRCTVCGGTGFPEQARIVGDELLDPLTAKQLFLDAKAFTRVITDPIHSVIVDMERHARHATRAQREWLILQHGTCARDGCTRLALDADIDHIIAWAAGGRTNLKDLRPLCPPDHVRRHTTRIRYRPRPDGTTQVLTPTGYTSDEPPPF